MGLGVGDFLQSLGAAAGGGLDAYTWQQENDRQNRAIDSRAEVARLNGEIRSMIARLNEGGRMDRHATASGNVLAQQAGATERNDADNFTQTNLAEMMEGGRNSRAATAEGGRNTRAANALTARDMWQRTMDATRRRGQDLTHDAAEMRDETTQRGQDLGVGEFLMRDATSRRGQDAVTERTRMRSTLGGLPPPEAPLPEAPAAQAPPADRSAMAAKLRAAIDAVNNARTPDEKAAAREALRQLRAQVK